jgi:hypothetical protein
MSAHEKSADRPLAYREVVAKYPAISPFIILKTDVQRRGVRYTPAAVAQADPNRDLLQVRAIFHSIGEKKVEAFPASLLLRDGTSIMVAHNPEAADPYVVDYVDGRIVLTDRGTVIDEVEYWQIPDYARKTTSSGRPMWQVVTPRPQRLDVHSYAYCHFWDTGQGCKYCNVGSHFNYEHKTNGKPAEQALSDISETIAEAVKQPGRFVNIMVSGGSILEGDDIFDVEVDKYIAVLQTIGSHFSTPRIPTQLLTSAFSLEQLDRIYNNTGVTTYTADLEVLNEEKFNWICPGKAERVGYKGWKQRVIDAVSIFGKGNVNSGIVGGAETATPHGFADEFEGLEVTLDEAEDLASHGVSVVYCTWQPTRGSAFAKQTVPSLEYYVLLAKGLSDLRRKYSIATDMDNYRLCGNHPDSDLNRI